MTRGRVPACTALAVAIALAACGTPASSDPVASVTAPPDAWRATVEQVVDGDTVWVTSLGGHPDAEPAGTSVKLRLLRIDTPELSRSGQPAECLAEAARDHLGSYLSHGEPVQLAWDVERRDRFGRDLVHLWDEEGRWVNGAMLADGDAAVVTFPPNVAHDDQVRRLEQQAREDGAGLWSAC